MKFATAVLCCFILGTCSVFAQTDQDYQTKDQVIVDDLVVQGSECVGIDCTNGESFGFDTERYKENNLRIHFDDTSNSASFPGNDWRIVINDSGNGGQNYFAVEDATLVRQVFKVRAGAPANSLYVSDAGNVGFKNDTPIVELHAKDGDSPTLRLEQTGASGFTPQTWDLAGNETNFFVRDVNHSSKLPFRIFPNAKDDALVIHNNGNYGLGTANPTGAIHLKHDSPEIFLDNNGTSNKDWKIAADENGFKIQNVTTNTLNVFQIKSDAPSNSFIINSSGYFGFGVRNPQSRVHVNGDISLTGTIMNLSDMRVKKDIKSIKNASEIVKSLDGKSYQFNAEKELQLEMPEGEHFGLLAQDVEKVLPHLVETFDMEQDQYKAVNYNELIPLLINAFNEQSKEVELLKTQNDALARRIKALENK